MSLGIARDLGHDLGISPLPGLTLWAEAGLGTGSADGTMFQSLSTTIEELGLTGGLATRYRPAPPAHRRRPRRARRPARARRDHRQHRHHGPTYDHGWGAMVSAAAALDLFIITPRRFGLGIRLEAGYVAAQGIALTPHTDRPDEAIPLTMTQLSLGHIDLSGPSAAVSLLGQF